MQPRNSLRRLKRLARRGFQASAEFLHTLKPADIAIFHDFAPPPAGGGHQFLRALWGEFTRQGYRVENNSISLTTRVCLFNSFNFDFQRLRRMRRAGCLMVHRIDGPVGVYRGFDDGTDARVSAINSELADATVFQSWYSFKKHQELGLPFSNPHVITNATNPEIFNDHNRAPFDRNRKTRLISASWSDNQNKGAKTYKWIEDHLDWDRYEYTFVGRSPLVFDKIKIIPPQPSEELAKLLRQHDIFITASRHESCPNALIEALACGLPTIYLNSGAQPEIAKDAGFPYEEPEEIINLLNRLVYEYEQRQANISLPTLTEVANQYLQVMGLR